MAVTKEQKEKNASTPGVHTGQSRDQVWDDDANPARANLAENKVKTGRDLPDKPDASAPKVKQPKA